MHSAPAVSYPVGRSAFYACLLGLTSLAGVLAGLLWRHQTDPAVWRQWLFAATVFGTAVAAWRAWRHSPCGTLQWDGRGWSLMLAGASRGAAVTVHLDLQWCLLLALRTDNGSRSWLWLERWRDVALWNALRRAVFSTATSDPASAADVDDRTAQVKS